MRGPARRTRSVCECVAQRGFFTEWTGLWVIGMTNKLLLYVSHQYKQNLHVTYCSYDVYTTYNKHSFSNLRQEGFA